MEPRETVCCMHLVGMINDAAKACDAVNERLKVGWIIDHMLSLPNSTLVVVYSRAGAIEAGGAEHVFRPGLNR